MRVIVRVGHAGAWARTQCCPKESNKASNTTPRQSGRTQAHEFIRALHFGVCMRGYPI
jgi:hypothetical protein